MSYIPDCRTKYEKDISKPYKGMEKVDEKAINPYWYGNLKGDDALFVAGYDWNTEQVVNNLFDNLDVYASEFNSIGLDVRDIDRDIVNGAYNECNILFNQEFADTRPVKWFNEYSQEDIDEMNDATKFTLMMKYILNHYIEMNRNELVTSMIEK